jgi:hypothetical protein
MRNLWKVQIMQEDADFAILAAVPLATAAFLIACILFGLCEHSN